MKFLIVNLSPLNYFKNEAGLICHSPASAEATDFPAALRRPGLVQLSGNFPTIIITLRASGPAPLQTSLP